MSYYFCKLVPPRADFAQTLTAAEMTAMQAHGAYWNDKAAANIALAIGLVADPQGFYGVSIVEVADETQLKAILDNDPAIRANLGLKYEFYPFPRGVIHR
jgi:hypothetical protein